MVYYAATIGLAVLAVVATKGSWQRLGRIHLSALPLLLVALAIQAALEIVDFRRTGSATSDSASSCCRTR